MAVFLIPSGLAAAQHKSSVWNPAVVLIQLLLADKMDSRVIVCKIVRHSPDLFFHLCRIRPFLKHHKTLSRMLLAGRQIRILSSSHRLQRFLHRNRILLRILHARNSSDCIRMSLADALPPERIILSLREDGIGIHPAQREHPRIPAYGDDPHLTALFRGRIHIGKMLRDSCVGVKTVHHMKKLCEGRSLPWQIRCASSA